MTRCVTCQDDFIVGEDDSGSRMRRSSNSDRSVATFEVDAVYNVVETRHDEVTMAIKLGVAKLSREVSTLCCD